ncbi:zf-HC2 domain-containing protein [bacterium]|nr:zf-HC2 domain-containing protein [candidate division CSSED10-310 bacterium]
MDRKRECESSMKPGGHLDDLIELYFDLLLDPVESLRFEAHLAECDRCAALIEQAEQRRGGGGGMFEAFAAPQVPETAFCMSDGTLAGFAENTLSEEERNLVEQHLGECPFCAARFERIVQESIDARAQAFHFHSFERGSIVVHGDADPWTPAPAAADSRRESVALIGSYRLSMEITTRREHLYELSITLRNRGRQASGVSLLLDSVESPGVATQGIVTSGRAVFSDVTAGDHRLILQRNEDHLGSLVFTLQAPAGSPPDPPPASGPPGWWRTP